MVKAKGKLAVCMMDGCENRCPKGWATCKPCAEQIGKDFKAALAKGKKLTMRQVRVRCGMPELRELPKPKLLPSEIILFPTPKKRIKELRAAGLKKKAAQAQAVSEYYGR